MRGTLDGIQKELSSVIRGGADQQNSDPSAGLAEHHRQQLLQFARKLERCGRRADRFLSLQLQQLQLAISDFEQEKAAWKRQQAREAAALERMRQELSLAGSRNAGTSSGTETGSADGRKGRRLVIPANVVASSNRPLKILLVPGTCSPLQIGLLMFELSKLNHELGGVGVRFEVSDCRLPRPQLFRRSELSDDDAIVALEAFSCQPLVKVNADDQVEVPRDLELQTWQVFKSQLLMSSLVDEKLHQAFQRSRGTERGHKLREMVHDAAVRANDANRNCYDPRRPLGPVLRALGEMNSVRQQLHRIEQCVATLGRDRKLRIHLSLV